jgi:hypothetical protein
VTFWIANDRGRNHLVMRRLTLPVLLFLAAPACTGEVLVGGEPGASSSASGSGGASTGNTGSTGTGGFGSTGSTGGGVACLETHDTLSIGLSTWQGITYACGATAADYEFSAAVVDKPAPGVLVLDGCSPAADCVQQLSKLSIAAPNVYLDVPQGAYVRVHVSISPFMGGCAQRVQIKNLPSWDGDPNPIQGGDALWFFGVDGDPSAFNDTALQATAEPLGCFPGTQPPGCGEHEDYSWRFQSKDDPNDLGVVVPMGATMYWGTYLGGQYQSLAIRNLRSYSTGICDGPVDLAYWIAHQYQLD